MMISSGDLLDRFRISAAPWKRVWHFANSSIATAAR